jgi:hypothetical protein
VSNVDVRGGSRDIVVGGPDDDSDRPEGLSPKKTMSAVTSASTVGWEERALGLRFTAGEHGYSRGDGLLDVPRQRLGLLDARTRPGRGADADGDAGTSCVSSPPAHSVADQTCTPLPDGRSPRLVPATQVLRIRCARAKPGRSG